MSGKRIEWLDIAKGIGIFLVVYAHARAPYNRYIYNFHMPFFFLISGMLYKSGGDLKKYIVRKIQTLYIPFVFWNLLFIIGKSIIRHQKISFDNVLKVVLTLEKDGEFLGATWFLGSLFFVAVVYKILDYYIYETNLKKFFLLGFFMVWATIGFEITLPYMLSRTLICGFFYALGSFGKELFINIKLDRTNFVYAVVSGGTFLIIGHYNNANMGANEYKYRLLFVIGAVFASFLMLYISKNIEKICSKNILLIPKDLICLLGKNSVDIVIWQFVAFRIVIMVQLWLQGISFEKIWDYYPVYSEKNGWWIIYTVVGCIVPIIWGMFLKAGPWGKILKKMHVVN